ncbi:CLB4 [Candida oxycetoniae]|uniref:CLB4 n=1 Tax=Candida oxycetoniae TaxID=497107 RepID=A0AAI9WZM2_9ASCO|nr:CLB4 [Candida oxycetoniae]KAI3406517.2 CLB4 [Candida oxycetoniae]
MRSYKSHNNDENLNQQLKGKYSNPLDPSLPNSKATNISRSHLPLSQQHPREALSDVTAQTNYKSRFKSSSVSSYHHQQQHSSQHSHHSSGSSSGSISHGITNAKLTQSKIQYYNETMQYNIHQYKKPRLEKVSGIEDEESTDEESKTQRNYSGDDEDKENVSQKLSHDGLLQLQQQQQQQQDYSMHFTEEIYEDENEPLVRSSKNIDRIDNENYEIVEEAEEEEEEEVGDSDDGGDGDGGRRRRRCEEEEEEEEEEDDDDEDDINNNNNNNNEEDEYIDETTIKQDIPTSSGITHQPRLSRASNKHQPMKPVWTPQIISEMKYIIAKYSRDTLDPNDEDTYDASMVAEYAPEIFNYMRKLEIKYTPNANYMDIQTELRWEMRAVLIDWVVQVHSKFNLLAETLFLTVNYIDRFLSKKKVSLSRFQLVGAVAFFIAAKYEEINCPTIQEVAFMADNAYTIDEFLKAERFMIDVLEFDMGWPGPMSFLRRTSKADDYDYQTRTLAKYFLEITIMDSRFVASPPSWLAAGAHYISRFLLNRGEWTELHVFYSGYTEKQLRPLAEQLLENCKYPEKNHKAIFEKYQERRFRRSSIFVEEYLESLR